MVKANEIDLVYCPTSEMVAGILTKGIAKPQFEELRSKLGLTIGEAVEIGDCNGNRCASGSHVTEPEIKL